MSISLEEAAKRIIICGMHEVDGYLDQTEVGMIIVAGHQIEDKDYEGIEKITCALNDPSLEHPSELVEKSIQQAKDFLENNPNKKLLIHCHAGRHSSATFAFLFLANLDAQEDLDLEKCIRHVSAIRQKSDLMDFDYFQSYLALQAPECRRISNLYKKATQIMCVIASPNIQRSAKQNILFANMRLSLEEAKTLCKRFGFEADPKLINIALCAANNDRPERTPSSPRIPGCP